MADENQLKTRKLLSGELEVGEPAPWHIYDSKGRLLLKKGMVMFSQRQIMKLLALGAFVSVSAEQEAENIQAPINDAMSPFQQIDGVVSRLDLLFNKIVSQPVKQNEGLGKHFYTMSKSIVELCEYDLDATIGAIHLNKKHKYTVVHPLHCAIISYVLATKIKLSERRVLSTIAAALTSNLGMFELQNELINQPGRLTEQQRIEVEKHTMRSAVLLRRIGVTDELWTEIVLQHHEKIDGSGYPRKLKGDEFIIEARIVGIADRYHAMVAPRDYRVGLSPTEALKKIFKDRGSEVDEDLSRVLIKQMGVYPPGSFVKLENDEIAIVTRLSDNRTKPNVKSIITPEGRIYSTPLKRESSNLRYRIVGLCRPVDKYNKDLAELWDYKLD